MERHEQRIRSTPGMPRRHQRRAGRPVGVMAVSVSRRGKVVRSTMAVGKPVFAWGYG